ncbi:hypothetical protein ABPG75_000084 [Micractinium tetrahymenae]
MAKLMGDPSSCRLAAELACTNWLHISASSARLWGSLVLDQDTELPSTDASDDAAAAAAPVADAEGFFSRRAGVLRCLTFSSWDECASRQLSPLVLPAIRGAGPGLLELEVRMKGSMPLDEQEDDQAPLALQAGAGGGQAGGTGGRSPIYLCQLPQELADPRLAIRRLRFVNCYFTEFPEVVARMGSLEELAIKNSDLSQFVDQDIHLSGLSRLTALRFSACAFATAPASIAALPALKHLAFEACPVTDGLMPLLGFGGRPLALAPELSALTTLESLSFYGCCLRSLPAAVGMKGLQRLVVDDTSVEISSHSFVAQAAAYGLRIPQDLLHGLENLQELSLKGSSGEKELRLALLPSLRRLRLQLSGFESVDFGPRATGLEEVAAGSLRSIRLVSTSEEDPISQADVWAVAPGEHLLHGPSRTWHFIEEGMVEDADLGPATNMFAEPPPELQGMDCAVMLAAELACTSWLQISASSARLWGTLVLDEEMWPLPAAAGAASDSDDAFEDAASTAASETNLVGFFLRRRGVLQSLKFASWDDDMTSRLAPLVVPAMQGAGPGLRRLEFKLEGILALDDPEDDEALPALQACTRLHALRLATSMADVVEALPLSLTSLHLSFIVPVGLEMQAIGELAHNVCSQLPRLANLQQLNFYSNFPFSVALPTLWEPRSLEHLTIKQRSLLESLDMVAELLWKGDSRNAAGTAGEQHGGQADGEAGAAEDMPAGAGQDEAEAVAPADGAAQAEEEAEEEEDSQSAIYFCRLPPELADPRLSIRRLRFHNCFFTQFPEGLCRLTVEDSDLEVHDHFNVHQAGAMSLRNPEGLLAGLENLQELSLHGGTREKELRIALPPSVRRVSLQLSGFESVDFGPRATGLEEVDLSGSALLAVPPCLAVAGSSLRSEEVWLVAPRARLLRGTSCMFRIGGGMKEDEDLGLPTAMFAEPAADGMDCVIM